MHRPSFTYSPARQAVIGLRTNLSTTIISYESINGEYFYFGDFITSRDKAKINNLLQALMATDPVPLVVLSFMISLYMKMKNIINITPNNIG